MGITALQDKYESQRAAIAPVRPVSERAIMKTRVVVRV